MTTHEKCVKYDFVAPLSGIVFMQINYSENQALPQTT